VRLVHVSFSGETSATRTRWRLEKPPPFFFASLVIMEALLSCKQEAGDRYLHEAFFARVVELAVTPVLGTGAFGREGSIPSFRICFLSSVVERLAVNQLVGCSIHSGGFLGDILQQVEEWTENPYTGVRDPVSPLWSWQRGYCT
jgi:hypothetical protein